MKIIMMKTTLSIIKADIGNIEGHIRASVRLVEEVQNYSSIKVLKKWRL